MRAEIDSIGIKEIDDEKYYGIHTLRALENFNIKNTKRVNSELIKSITLVKGAAAITNNKIKKLSDEKKNAILDAVEKITNELYLNKALFPLPAIQGGAGTSTNMNVNEIIANLGLEFMGKKKGEYEFLDPIEDVNLSQSTNDVYPTAVKITVIRLLKELVEEVKNLQEELQKKEDEFATVKKIGRTQLQDAVKITLGQEFGAYGEVISRDRWRLYKIEERIRMVNIGGTAIGTGIASSIEYRAQITSEIQRITGLGIARAENLIDNTQNLDVFVEVSGLLKTLAVSLNKIANDLRWMSSGPYGGLNEINLKKLQMGSTIMPEKVNPVGAEHMRQIYYRVVANDLTITQASTDGEFELNSNLPIIAESILETIELLRDGIALFRKNVICEITVNKEHIEKILNSVPTRLSEEIGQYGYNKVAEMIRKEKEKKIE